MGPQSSRQFKNLEKAFSGIRGNVKIVPRCSHGNPSAIRGEGKGRTKVTASSDDVISNLGPRTSLSCPSKNSGKDYRSQNQQAYEQQKYFLAS